MTSDELTQANKAEPTLHDHTDEEKIQQINKLHPRAIEAIIFKQKAIVNQLQTPTIALRTEPIVVIPLLTTMLVGIITHPLNLEVLTIDPTTRPQEAVALPQVGALQEEVHLVGELMAEEVNVE